MNARRYVHRRLARLSLRLALARDRHRADALRGRGPGRPGAPAARRADVVVPLAQDHPAAPGPRDRARPDRLRPLRQARGHRLVLVRPPRRLDRAARRGARPAATSRSSSTTGAARSACASRSSMRSASTGSCSSTPASAAARRRASGGCGSARSCASSAARSTSAGSSRPAPRRGSPTTCAQRTTLPFPTPESKAGALAFPELVPTEPEHPNTAPMNRVRDALREWHKPALVVWGAEDTILPTGIAERWSR